MPSASVLINSSSNLGGRESEVCYLYVYHRYPQVLGGEEVQKKLVYA